MIRAYFSASGRFTRRQYILYFLGPQLLFVILGTVYLLQWAGSVNFEKAYVAEGVSRLFLYLSISGFLLGLMPTIKRLHDISMSGWFVLAGLIPRIGSFLFFILAFIPGEKEENKYGDNPRQFLASGEAKP
ncbi:DUF805 domain-containing protein [Microbulbifer pacificus]|uniref:DUF805 domain-containing protein n=1 Tax=Microbulbifer pacificus TaxID=407164 RepID=A0AAU0MWS3_9GAMM|nr:DUF805 domain-containing protein [Microbulbifer pacificus]WOX05065.1 DUF805 domain-containing protein [Microbulbifer pacificus]